MLKPFAISARETFTLAIFILNLPSDDKEERKKRSALYREFKADDIKKRINHVKSIEEIKDEQEKQKADPFYVNPKSAYPHQYADDSPTIRVDLHASTIDYAIAKLSGKMEAGGAADVLADLCDRLISVRDTNEDRICSSDPTPPAGYRLPPELWTAEERATDNAKKAPRTSEEARAVPVADAAAAG